MATLRQFYYRVLEGGQFRTLLPAGISNFFDENLLNGDKASKISIQAPPGTEIQLDNKSIIIGRSGLYDFDNTDVPAVTSLVFPQPKRYIRSGIDHGKQASLEEDLQVIETYLESLIKTRTLIQNSTYFTDVGLTEGAQTVQQDTTITDYTEVTEEEVTEEEETEEEETEEEETEEEETESNVASFKFNNDDTVYYSLQSNFNFKSFCLNGQLIYQGERNKTASQSDYNFNLDGTTLYGFSNVLSEYLKTIQGELTTENIDIMNVVVNYITN